MKKKVIDVQPPTVLDKKELVADAYEHCSHAAPPCSAESHSKVAHRLVVELAEVLEEKELPALLTSIVRTTLSNDCDTILAEAISSTHGLKDFSSNWTFALTFGIVLSEHRRGSPR